MANYEEARIKLSFQDEELTHELSLTTRQESNIRKALAKAMSTDIKISKA